MIHIYAHKPFFAATSATLTSNFLTFNTLFVATALFLALLL